MLEIFQPLDFEIKVNKAYNFEIISILRITCKISFRVITSETQAPL